MTSGPPSNPQSAPQPSGSRDACGKRRCNWPVRALALLVLAPLVTACDRGNHPDRLDRVAPAFSVADDTTSLDLARLRGKVVVLNLWASWCAPCVEELPSLLELQRRMPELAVVGVSIDEDSTAYRAFLERHHVNFRNVRDPERRINALYGTEQIPETYIIDRNGILRRKFISAQNWTDPEILAYLRHLE